MASAITAWGASFVLNAMFGQRDTPPAYYYVALLTTIPGTQVDGSTIAEPPTASNYARVQMMNDTFSWGGAVNGVVASTAQVVFPVAALNWPTTVGYALCDSLVGGQVYLYGSFAVPRTVLANDQAQIGTGALSLSVTSLSSALSSTF